MPIMILIEDCDPVRSTLNGLNGMNINKTIIKYVWHRTMVVGALPR